MSFWRFGRPPRLRSGQPAPLGQDEQRSPPFVPFAPHPYPTYALHPQPSVGAAAFSFQGHLQQINYNPIGAGVVVPYPFRPVGQQPTGYLRGVLLFDFQRINNGVQPQPGGPLWSPGQLAAIMGNYSLAASFTPEQAAGLGSAGYIPR